MLVVCSPASIEEAATVAAVGISVGNSPEAWLSSPSSIGSQRGVEIIVEPAESSACLRVESAENKDCTGEGYSGLRVDVLASGCWACLAGWCVIFALRRASRQLEDGVRQAADVWKLRAWGAVCRQGHSRLTPPRPFKPGVPLPHV